MKRLITSFFACGLAFFFAIRCCLAQQPNWLVAPNDSISSINSFSEGLAHVSVWSSQEVYYMDSSGQLKSFGHYENSGNFHNGLAWVSLDKGDGNRLFGFINKKGILVVPCIYDEVQDFACHRAAVKLKGIWQYIDPDGKTAIADDYIVTKTAAINGDLQTVMMDATPPAFHSGRVVYRDKNGLYGYRDTSGAFIIPSQFNLAHDFSGNVAVVADTIAEQRLEGDDTLTRLYNSLPSGPPSYRSRIIDLNGKTLFSLDSTVTLDMNRNFSNGLCSFLKQDQDSSGWGVMNAEGKVIIAPIYRNEPMPNYDGVSFVQVDGDESTGNRDGYLLTFDSLGQVIGKIPFVTASGEMHDSNLGFHEGLMAVQLGDYWGYIDAKGKIIIQPQFDAAMNFQEGFAVVKTSDGKIGVIRNPLK